MNDGSGGNDLESPRILLYDPEVNVATDRDSVFKAELHHY